MQVPPLRLPSAILAAAVLTVAWPANAQELVSFPTADGGVVYANVYGEGDRGVVLAHGRRFTKESWAEQAPVLAAAGFRVVAIDFRGRGQSHGGPQEGSANDVYFDVLAAVRYLRDTGARTVSVIGASFGGGAAAQAAVEAEPGEIDRLVLLAHVPIEEPERMQGAKLFIVAREDLAFRGTPQLAGVRDQYERASGPKELVILEGSAHAQFLFETDQAERLMDEILRFLSAPPSQLRAINFAPGMPLEETAETSANASLADLDGDGDLDIVLAKGRHWPLVDFVLLNDGAGGFTQRHEVGGTADRTYTAAVADLDGDGDVDLVVGNDRPDDKRVYLNDGTGHFVLSGTFGESDWPTRNVTVADLNGDQRPEIIVANRGGPDNLNANYICVNDGGGAFPRCDVLSTESATTIAAGDLTGDGFVDLFVPHRDGGQSFLFVNDGNGGFDERHPVGPAVSATRAVTLGDLDGDGRLDIVMGAGRAGGVLLYINRGDATFDEPIVLGDSDDTAYSLAVADLDGDGDTDVVVGNAGAPGAILSNDGDGRSFTMTLFGDAQGAMYGLAIGDVNGDGVPDIVAGRSEAPNTLYVGCCR